MDDHNDTFLGPSRDLDLTENSKTSQVVLSYMEPAELIVSRVVFALLVSVSLVMNLLLLLAVFRRRKTIHVIYCFTASMLLPDLIFYCKLVIELMNWGEINPSWAKSDWSCALWQFVSHWYPILYSVLLTAVVYHAFITLFLDYSGNYEEKCRKYFLLIYAAIIVVTAFMVAPSAIYSREKKETPNEVFAHFRQYCDLSVPSLMATQATEELGEEAKTAFRLVYELVLPYLLPLIFLIFPYVTLLLGLMRNLPAANHSEYSTKITVVVTLWLVTSYLMLHVSSIMRNMFSVFSVWHRLMALFDAFDDERVPKFQTYIHIVAYALTCIWGIFRAALCFKYNIKLRKALGP